MSFGDEQEPVLKISSGRGHGLRKLYFTGRMWSGGAREHYVSEIGDRKLP